MSQDLASPNVSNSETDNTSNVAARAAALNPPNKGLLGLLNKNSSLTLDIKSDATSQFTQKYSSAKTYLSVTQGLTDKGSETINSLDQTTLDDPINTDLVTQYPQFAQGQFGGATQPFSQQWNEENGYATNSNQDAQANSLGLSGLDVENPSAASTTDNPLVNTNYPELARGEYNSSPTQYTQKYTPRKTYLDDITQIRSVATNTQTNTLDETGLDNTDPKVVPTTTTPDAISYPTEYPYVSPQVSLGEFQSAPSQYDQVYTPTKTYLDSYTTIKDVNTNPQTSVLDETALDIENQNAINQSQVYSPTNPNTATVYPANNVTGVNGDAPQNFDQVWKPTNEYYPYMKTNYEAH
jgi:hypothetical protein